jgi:mRNA interferase MazF
MGLFTVGQIIVLPFPFSDLTQNKYRPGLLLANVEYGDWIVCQITSKSYKGRYEIEIQNSDLLTGNLRQVSYVRVSKLFTAKESVFTGIIGQLKSNKMTEVREAIINLF